MKLLDHLEEYFIAVLMAAATLITFTAVVHRYLSGIDIPVIQDALIKINMSWAQELTIYLFVWMAKFGAAYGVRSGIHVGVDVLVNRLSEKNKKVFILMSLGAGAIFTGVVGTLGANFVWGMAHTDQTSSDLEMPMWIVYLAIPLGSYLMSFRFMQVAWHYVRTGDLPKHDHSHVEGLDVEEAVEAAQEGALQPKTAAGDKL
ncbi:TRAP transporter small permease [Undibacterium sp. LX40W]|uniref:TRAP transporter small permease protein n=1 Tax=Undibacterium nitidum TaxID=2762298 RepID=A0A923HU22_9BURK|nr:MULTISPECIES: TRAP transporter small permease [Undibacterium]MBC3882607.1 TRAP transporter small permease [Undibacterium nitidum]MBC3892888.1 TRAP transporter small permease [Undibacterium sp. LX40W]